MSKSCQPPQSWENIKTPIKNIQYVDRTLKTPPNANLCGLYEVKVLESPSVATTTDNSETVTSNHQTAIDPKDDNHSEVEVRTET